MLPEPPKFCPQAPTPKQAAFLALTCREALYGGGAGSGKTSALLMSALQYVHIPGYSALVLRRSYADLALPDAIMDRAKAWLRPQGVRWSSTDKRFTFPSGATLTFGYLKSERDRYRYAGSAYQFIGWDEVTQFTLADYLWLMSRLRYSSSVAGRVPLRVRAATNPGGVGHEWVRARFLPSTDPLTGEVVYPTDENGERRVFIPALLNDNPHLDPESYRRSLQALDPVTRAQLLHGDWDARPPGEMFDRAWFGLVWKPEEQAALREAVIRWCRFWDLASTERRAGAEPDWTVGVLMGRTADDMIVVADVVRVQAKAPDVENLIVETAARDANLVGCRTIRIEQEPGSSGAYAIDAFARRLIGYDFSGVRTSGPKAERARPFASYARQGLVRVLVGPWTSDYLAELEAFPSPHVHDDQVDASSGAFATIASMWYSGAATIEPDPVTRLTR